MPSFTQLFTLAVLATVSFAATLPPAGHAHCKDAKVVHDDPIEVDGHIVHFTGFSCAAKGVSRREPVDPSILPRTTSVCGVNCNTACNNNAGVLPPISQDCDTIRNAIQIFSGKTSSTFTVASNHLETLTFGTCSYFFTNTGSSTLESCWSDLSTTGSAAGAACFPPVQPFSSEGLCASYDGTWGIGAAHS